MEVMADTLAEMLNQAKAPAIRKVSKTPKTQASSSKEPASEAESEELSSDESADPHKARPLPPTSIAGSRQSSKGSKTSKKKSIMMISFQAKKTVQSAYLEMHEDKLRITPEDFALTISDLAERPGLMYDQHTFERADWEIRSWGTHFEIEVEAMAKLDQRKREKQ